ncbi:MAG: hypothetical protein VX963_09745 [Actinomycetota bacterium]|nr:hypothetical protein [Actinomycetota bacterium]MEC9058512.1 hypothetical protein [Actinomycetota bacterium]
MNRSEHIAGLELSRLTPADIEYFFRTLLPRVPGSTREENQHLLDLLRSRLRDTAVHLGDPTAHTFDPKDIERVLGSICDRLERMKRREWKVQRDGISVLKQLRIQVGEISADLHGLATG